MQAQSRFRTQLCRGIIDLLLSAGIQTPAEIEELSLRTPRPVAIYLCESEATAAIKQRYI
ncbi:hypothetical protein [Lysinibacillus xylanilyticus]|uniref:hypothetical protein n=1 Tax=Lysinibacillus xylanilyticus TaxID=582475 RepID=UPI000A6A50C0